MLNNYKHQIEKNKKAVLDLEKQIEKEQDVDLETFDRKLYDEWDIKFFTPLLKVKEYSVFGNTFLYFISGAILLMCFGYGLILLHPVLLLVYLCLLPGLKDDIKLYLNRNKKVTILNGDFPGYKDIEPKKIEQVYQLRMLQNELLKIQNNISNRNETIKKEKNDKIKQLSDSINLLKSKNTDLQNQIDNEVRNQRRKDKNYWLKLSGIEFENEICELFNSIGIKSKVTKASDDEGIDVIIQNKIMVQCKHYTSSKVTPKEVREFQGATEFANKSIFIGTNGFSERAIYQASKNNTLLLDLNDVVAIKNNSNSTIEKLKKYIA